MNERIKALADKASNDINMVGYHNIPDEFKQKFAELIIKECMKVCQDTSVREDDGQAYVYSDAIQEHFGVE